MTPMEQKASVRAWLEGLTQEPPRGVAEAKQFLELAADLFDEEHLDGEQYAAVYDVGRALQSPGLAGLAHRALKIIG